MRKSKFTETQIIAMIKETDSGVPVPEVCRKYGVGQSTIFINGGQSMVVWKPPMLSALKNLKKKTESLRTCLLP